MDPAAAREFANSSTVFDYSGGHWNLVVDEDTANRLDLDTFRVSADFRSAHGAYRHGGYAVHVDCGNPTASLGGLLVHGIVDVIGGNIGAPDLDNICLGD
jgi:hypothetical protein